MKKYEILRIKIDKALANFTLAKFCGAIMTVSIVAALKYLISGDFHIEYCDFWTNVGIGLLGWTLNTGLIGLFTEYLGIKGININLNQFIFGFETMNSGGVTKVDGRPSSAEVLEDSKPKLYNAMDSGEGSSTGNVSNKGKDVETPKPSEDTANAEYWKAQKKIYEDGLKAKDKLGVNLTDDERYAVQQLIRINEYDRKKIEDSLSEVKRNVNFPLHDKESVRLENVRLGLSRDAELRKKGFNADVFKIEEQNLNSATTKLQNIAEYNRKNHKHIGIKKQVASDNIIPFTDTELECVVKRINNDPNASAETKKMVETGTIIANIGPNNLVLKYLENITKNK